MGIKLYEAAAQLDVVNGWIEEHADEILANGGALPPALAELLDQAEGTLAEKVERVALKVRELVAEADAIKAESARLTQRHKTAAHAAESLRTYLQRVLEATGTAQVKGMLVTVALQQNPPAALGELTQEQLEYLYEGPSFGAMVSYVPASYALNRKAVLEAFKRQEPLPEGIRVAQATSLRIH